MTPNVSWRQGQSGAELWFRLDPKYEKGFLAKLFGDKTVIRASFAINYYDEGMNTVSNNAFRTPGRDPEHVDQSRDARL